MFNILVYVNLVFNILFTFFLIVVFTGVLKNKNQKYKQDRENKKSKQTQDYRRKGV